MLNPDTPVEIPKSQTVDLSDPSPDVTLADIQGVEGEGLEGLEREIYERCVGTVAEIEKFRAQLKHINAQREQLVGLINRESGKLDEGRTILLNAVRSRAKT